MALAVSLKDECTATLGNCLKNPENRFKYNEYQCKSSEYGFNSSGWRLASDAMSCESAEMTGND